MYRPGIRSLGVGAFLLFFLYISIVSCVSPKKVVYFNDVPDTMTVPTVLNNITQFEDPKIQSNDNLAITIQTIVQNDKTNQPISTNAVGTFNPLNGYLVDKNGYIELSLVGFVKVGGLTTAEARELIKQKAKEFYKEPVVNVRIANFGVSVLGDVNKPGVVNLVDEKATLLDAIALSGDLSLSARRDNILLIRDEGDHKKFERFDLRSSKIFQSPDFYLKQRDIIYVEPNRNKVQTSDNTFIRNLGIMSSLISIASLLLVFKSLK